MSSRNRTWKIWIFVLVLLLLAGVLLLRWFETADPAGMQQEAVAEDATETDASFDAGMTAEPGVKSETDIDPGSWKEQVEYEKTEEPVPKSTIPDNEPSSVPTEEQIRKAVYTEQTYRLVTDLVYTRRHQGKEAEPRIQELLTELKTEDPALGALWEGIMNYWQYVGDELTINRDVLPDGLPDDNSLCIVVLGFQLMYDGEMTPELEGRCKTALESAKKYPNAFLLVTGGGTAYGNRSATEADVMAKWLEERGIAQERILIENRSLTTDQNAVFSCEILTRNYPEITCIAVITSDYHVALGSMLFTEAALIYAYEHNCEVPYRVVSNAGFRTSGNEIYSNPAYFGSDIWVMANPTY